jgi:hypothetical protein
VTTNDLKLSRSTLKGLLRVFGAVVLLAGVLGLLVPVSVPDGQSGSIGCGSVVAEDTTPARDANDRSVANLPIVKDLVAHSDYVAECQTALSGRGSWSIPVTIIGAAAVAAGVVLRGRGGGPRIKPV